MRVKSIESLSNLSEPTSLSALSYLSLLFGSLNFPTVRKIVFFTGLNLFIDRQTERVLIS